MKKLAVGLVLVVCLALVVVAAKAYWDDQHLLLHPKEWYTADLYLDAAYVNGTGAVFVDVSVYWAEDGFVNFTTATITDHDGRVVAKDNAFNMVVESGKSATLKVYCNATVPEKAEVTLCASGWGTMRREIIQGNPAPS